ncbi:hypothetical protein [Ralstonia syzygii]|uniref:hypothetical protein n=1 Tax=Ralstonia syzygii TaxID=28097 RepID=UPI0018D10AEC|nr:hypothetical protein [Ralstonia syzygii]
MFERKATFDHHMIDKSPITTRGGYVQLRNKCKFIVGRLPYRVLIVIRFSRATLVILIKPARVFAAPFLNVSSRITTQSARLPALRMLRSIDPLTHLRGATIDLRRKLPDPAKLPCQGFQIFASQFVYCFYATTFRQRPSAIHPSSRKPQRHFDVASTSVAKHPMAA